MNSILAISPQIFTFLLFTANGALAATLSTAVFRDENISVKPTVLYRRIAVDRNVDHQTITAPDLFHMTDLRRNQANIWNWDYLCQLQPQTGNCTVKRQKYYYSSHLDNCLPFTYTGCGGNKNKFNTILDCERHCKGAAYMSVRSIDRTTACALQPNAGLCVAMFYNNGDRTDLDEIWNGDSLYAGLTQDTFYPGAGNGSCGNACGNSGRRYYYDVNKRSCTKFIYSGCGGNQNRFSTNLKCIKKCGKKGHSHKED